MKTYKFFDDGYWSGTGCDCCEDIWMESWNCILLEYTCYSIEECYQAAIAHATQMPYDEQEKLYWLSYEELEELLDVLGIEVVFIEDGEEG